MHSEKAVDYSQIRLVIIQNNLAKNKEQLNELIKFLMKSKEIPSRALLAITDDNIEKLLSNINDKLGVNATSIYDYFKKGAGWAPEVSSISIWEAYRSLTSYTKDIAIPVVSSGQDTVLSYEGSAVLKNGKMIERISPNESQLINLFQNHTANGRIESLGFASIMVTSSSIQNKASMNSSKPLVSSDLKLKIEILERKEGMTENEIQKELEKLIEKRFYHMFEQAQESHTDIFGFGQYFRRQISYQELKDWRDEYYPKLNVNFQVKASIE
jgi:Ger(x)C family germination protein